jgi:hypothetical protein
MTNAPQTPYEQASYDLNNFRERRLTERRANPRNGPDRRANGAASAPMQQNDNLPDDSSKDLH